MNAEEARRHVARVSFRQAQQCTGGVFQRADGRRVAGLSVNGVMRIYLLRPSPVAPGDAWGWLLYGFSFDYQSRTGA